MGAIVISLKERKEEALREQERLRQEERQEDAFAGKYGMDSFVDAIRALKEKVLPRRDVQRMEAFLIRHFSIQEEELRFDDLLIFEMETMDLSSVPPFDGIVKEVIPCVKIAAQNGRLTEIMAVRIIKVARFMYRI